MRIPKNEREFAEYMRDFLRKVLKDMKVDTGKAFLYSLNISPDGEVVPHNYKKPTRGHSAFETDISIYKTINGVDIPFVIIETKFGGMSSHDVIVYSEKAHRHKQIYPHLRYGLLLGGKNSIPFRFFQHNNHFDFCIVYSGARDEKPFLNVIKKEITFARKNMELLSRKKKVRQFIREIRLV